MDKNKIKKFLDARTVVIFGTIDLDGTPVTRALMNIRNPHIAPHLAKYFKKEDRLLFITNTGSEKISEIRTNPVTSLYCYDDEFNGLLLTGKTSEVTDEATKNALWDDSWKMYYPDGRDGGDFSVLEFIPKNYKYYSGFKVERGAV